MGILRRSERWGSVTIIRARLLPFFQFTINFSMACRSVIIGSYASFHFLPLPFYLMKYLPDKPPVLTNRHEFRPACTANSAFSAGWISGLVDATAVHYLSLESWISGSIPLDALRVRPMCLSPVPRPLGIWSYASVRRSLPLISNFPPGSANFCATFNFAVS